MPLVEVLAGLVHDHDAIVTTALLFRAYPMVPETKAELENVVQVAQRWSVAALRQLRAARTERAYN